MKTRLCRGRINPNIPVIFKSSRVSASRRRSGHDREYQLVARRSSYGFQRQVHRTQREAISKWDRLTGQLLMGYDLAAVGNELPRHSGVFQRQWTKVRHFEVGFEILI